uniref:Uncharacterized protein n=1 Tax=Timema bartmani TaxID=61472 RepID=A0A7R9F234_9NEOP|nr:unnamed protein product [Timema bartmani]
MLCRAKLRYASEIVDRVIFTSHSRYVLCCACAERTDLQKSVGNPDVKNPERRKSGSAVRLTADNLCLLHII